MNSQNQPIEIALKSVVSGVKKASNGKQEPWMEGSIEGDFYFNNNQQLGTLNQNLLVSPSLGPNKIQAPVDIEAEIWERIKSSKNIEDYKDYLKNYPTGKFSTLVNIQIRNLQNPSSKPTLSDGQIGSSLVIENNDKFVFTIFTGTITEVKSTKNAYSIKTRRDFKEVDPSAPEKIAIGRNFIVNCEKLTGYPSVGSEIYEKNSMFPRLEILKPEEMFAPRSPENFERKIIDYVCTQKA